MSKPIAVFGLGISNLSVIKALCTQGRDVIVWDDNETARDKAIALGARAEPLTAQTLAECELLVLAPGVPLHFPEPHDVVKAAREANVEIICDIELRYRQGWSCETIGITGTNGKSTTTALIGHTLNASGIAAAVGGNIGTPIFDLEMPDENGVLVLELSSYQLDLCPTFRPDISILLNITPDHLDRHGTMENYAAAKQRMFEGNGKAIITGDDTHCTTIKNTLERPLLELKTELQEQTALRGSHNKQNMSAALAACKEIGLNNDQIIKAFETFPGLPHRQFLTRKIGHVEYINDSKATNAEATSKALASFDNIYWIVGGQSKDGGLSGLEEFLPRIKKTYLIGESSDEFANYLDANNAQYSRCETMDNAVKNAHQDAQNTGESSVLLLSPAAASFDQYKNFEKRGDHFTTLVEALDT